MAPLLGRRIFNMKFTKSFICYSICIFLTPPAYADLLNSITGTATTVAAGVGTTVIVMTLMGKRLVNLQEKDKAEKLAEIFIRDNSLNIDQDLALGEGKIINELAAAFEIKSDMRLQFGQLLKNNRAALLSFATLKNLTPRRAGEFMRTVATTAEIDANIGPAILEFKLKYSL